MTSVGQLHRSWAADLDAATVYELLRLRVDIFVVEQACPYPELDGRDLESTTRHFWISDADGVVLATLRLLEDAEPGSSATVFRIGRVCTERSARGQGLTKRLMEAALAEVGDGECRVEAQAYLTDMYAKFGFRSDGGEYLEDGIPHVSMRRGGPTR
ncbi:GNAT family N-acetyltransferase [Gordonia soli]|uniref:N-acetyltransferase domain-containing protein n=1 Tax=Gordonia soli NBRC 108243 TaxID=1223545 RepID=M0QNF7_9ACTN|nr:GNAT family N-acetyltransferase [Gordonia soli]GAC68957.1 hypothetical protein GS4_20_00220 [Gordonia soli NBRC 108243]